MGQVLLNPLLRMLCFKAERLLVRRTKAEKWLTRLLKEAQDPRQLDSHKQDQVYLMAHSPRILQVSHIHEHGRAWPGMSTVRVLCRKTIR